MDPILDRSDFIRRLNEQFTFDPKSTAVVTIDMHRGHLDPKVATLPVPAERAARVLEKSRRLLRAAREAGLPIIHVILVKRPVENANLRPFHRAVVAARQFLTPDAPSNLPGHNLDGSIQTELMPEVGPEAGDYVIDNKKTLSIFYGTDLEYLLKVLKVETLIFLGINTNTCVQCACFEASNRLYTLAVISDCADSMYGRDLHAFALQNIARCMGWVLTTEEFLAKLERAMAGVS